MDSPTSSHTVPNTPLISSELRDSLAHYFRLSNNPKPSFVKTFPTNTNPQPFRELGDSALYWISERGFPLTLAFTGILSIPTKFPKIGPYFNMNTGRAVNFFFPFFSKTEHFHSVDYSGRP
jgi:hypothetical protein